MFVVDVVGIVRNAGSVAEWVNDSPQTPSHHKQRKTLTCMVEISHPS